ncbi:MAG: alpha-L-rhamnosidase [Verrucomicrobiales bacterium]|nr:alpha-L-rhamnosidase [Verrucomicrobiales bacterium]
MPFSPRVLIAATRLLALTAGLLHAAGPDSAPTTDLDRSVRPAPAALAVLGDLSAEASPLRSWFLPPTRILWQSATGVANASNLLQPKPGQAVLKEPQPPCVLTGRPEQPAGILLDFGVEIQGYVELFTPMTDDKTPPRVRVRFGESASEAMAEPGGTQSAQNDHALRDQVVELPWLGKKTVGPSGFRFVRLDAIDPEHPVHLSQVRAVLVLRDLPYVGSFRCDDDRLNRIWEVGAYTVHLNMQDYLWDGIKRDRLVWLGDMHPEVSTINAVFGNTAVVPRSLDLIRDVTPPTEWMNGISSYSMWWVIIQEDWWMHHGDRAYLEAQAGYLRRLLRRLCGFVDAAGRETLDGMRFLDWPTYENKQAVHEGLQAMMMLCLGSGARLSDTLGDPQTAGLCREAVVRLRRHQPESSGRKSPAALLALAGARDPEAVARNVLAAGGPRDLSTFYGFYVLEALAAAGEIDRAIAFIQTYWGAMLDLGATTFWEDFNLEWMTNAGRIDELVPPGRKDIHGDCGAHCYVGFRHSLCHGWASGPTAWLSRHVLGIRPLEPGCRRLLVAPNLGPLAWAEGSYPTPSGPVRVRHEKQADGTIRSEVDAPAGITWVRKASPVGAPSAP